MNNRSTTWFITLCVTVIILVTWGFFAFHRITTDPQRETAIIDKPFFGGTGGVRPTTQLPGSGWYWFSTEGWTYITSPFKQDELLEHLPTAEIMTDPITLQTIEDKIKEKLEARIKETGLHVKLLNIAMGKVLPDPPVVVEMNNTAVQQQRKKTEVQRKGAEDDRKAAETSRAAADNAYRLALGLNPNEFVQLESIKRYSEACAKSTCTIINGSVPIVVGKP